MITFRLYVQLFLNLIENDAEINLVVVLVDGGGHSLEVCRCIILPLHTLNALQSYLSNYKKQQLQ